MNSIIMIMHGDVWKHKYCCLCFVILALSLMTMSMPFSKQIEFLYKKIDFPTRGIFLGLEKKYMISQFSWIWLHFIKILYFTTILKKNKKLFNLNMLLLGLGRIFHNGTHIIPKMNSNIRSDHISCEISEMVMMVSDCWSMESDSFCRHTNSVWSYVDNYDAVLEIINKEREKKQTRIYQLCRNIAAGQRNHFQVQDVEDLEVLFQANTNFNRLSSFNHYLFVFAFDLYFLFKSGRCINVHWYRNKKFKLIHKLLISVLKTSLNKFFLRQMLIIWFKI